MEIHNHIDYFLRLFEMVISIGTYMGASGKSQFNSALEYLQTKYNRYKKDSVLKTYNLLLKGLQPRDGWSLLNELFQNAVDIGATRIKLVYNEESGEMIFQHNADISKYPLDCLSIQGLCGISESTKGLKSVGFMGIGFKFFTKFFEQVSISDGRVSFSIIHQGNDWKQKIESLYSPVWLSKKLVPDKGYTTMFKFQKPIPGGLEKITKSLDSVKLERFVLFAQKGLKTVPRVQFQVAEVDIIAEKDIKDTLLLKKGDEEKKYLVLEEKVIVSDEAKLLLIDNRSADTTSKEKLSRTISLIVELEGEEGNTTLSTRNEGQLFCLVPLGATNFPFKVGLDADWFMSSDRLRLNCEDLDLKWHAELIEPTFPKLLKRYLTKVGTLAGKKRIKATDIFPNWCHQYDNEFDFLNTASFIQKLSAELGDCEFILCADGKVRKLSEVKNVPPIPSILKVGHFTCGGEMDELVYQKFLQCINAPLIDRFSISQNTIDYLNRKLNYLPYPNINDFDIEKIKLLWDEDNPIPYMNILDIVSDMIEEGIGPQIVPLKANGKWGSVLDPNLVFEAIPNTRGNEKELFEKICIMNPNVKLSKEVHDKLKGLKNNERNTRHWDNSGNKWKNNKKENSTLYEDSLKINEIICDLENQNESLLSAVLYFSLRIGNSALINYLETEGGVSVASECFIPPPFGNILIKPIEENRIISQSMIIILNKFKSSINIIKFLNSAKLMTFKPKIKTTHANTEAYVLEHTGIPVSGTNHKSTWSGDKGAPKDKYGTGYTSLKNGWRVIDYKWPIDFSKLEHESLSKYLSEPEPALEKSLLKSLRKKYIKYYNNGPQGPIPSSRDCSWLADLKSNKWVKCSDGEFRKPSNSPLEGSEREGDYHAVLEEKFADIYEEIGVKFDSNWDEMDPAECMERWKSKPVRRKILFLKKLKEWNVEEVKKRHCLDQILWLTGGELSPHTRLSNFVNKTTSLDGFIGNSNLLGETELEEFEKIGYRFKDDISEEMLINLINTVTNQVTNKNEMIRHEPIFQKAWKMLLSKNYDLSKLNFLNIHFDTVEFGEKKVFITLVKDDDRFEVDDHILLNEQLPSDIISLRKLYDSAYNVQLIDNLVDINFDIEELSQSLQLSRVIKSMGLDFKIYFCDKKHKICFDGDEHDGQYLIHDKNRIVNIFVWNIQNSVTDICEFLIGQDREKFVRYQNLLVQTVLLWDTFWFEKHYEKFCKKAGLEVISKEEIEKTINFTSQEKINADISMKKSQPGRIRIGDQKEAQETTNNEKSIKKTDTNKNNTASNLDSGTFSVEQRNDLKEMKTKDIFTSAFIGKRAEDVVAEKLKNMDWVVNNTNDYKNNFPGFDLIATRGELTRRIEVKGQRREWVSAKWTNQQGITYYRTIEEDKGQGKLEYWICIVENILNEEETEISSIEPDIWPINVSREKPDFSISPSWKTRLHPDKDF